MDDSFQRPTTRTIIDRLIAQLSVASSQTSDDRFSSTEHPGFSQKPSPAALRGLSPPDRQLVVTLHCIFPHQLLPALDLLDRRLVTRFVLNDDENGGHSAHVASTPPVIFYVHSTQNASARGRSHGASWLMPTTYEVRLTAWSCTCPGFILTATSKTMTVVHEQEDQDSRQPDSAGSGRSENGHFGGVTLGMKMPPICKHLLACYMAQHCPGLFRGHVEQKKVSKEELVAWVAGWGD
ncbi:MAG: hypothetical protein M1823_002149 [Watsoniomyces obsoletus]|nr:MAG: hypothetical protein M1823_002149 [Watsoniomyces obsoletus]